MARLSLLFFLLTAACSVYKSPGRKFLEQHIGEYSNGALSLTYDCRPGAWTPNDGSMVAIGDLRPGVTAWRIGTLPAENWHLTSASGSCQFIIQKRMDDPALALLNLLKQYIAGELDERP